MNFLSLAFFPFVLISFAAYWLTDKKYRYLVLLAANYVFYSWCGSLAAVITLLLSTGLTYIGGLLLSKRKQKWLYGVFFAANLLMLIVYKYTDFLIENVNLIGVLALGYSGDQTLVDTLGLVAPIGLSFYIFQSSTYLNDVYRKGMPAEVNFFRYAAFVSFFPSILSGPIQKSRDLLPQIKDPAGFSFEQAREGMLLLVWGYFQKIVVAGKLAAISNVVYQNYQSYDNVYYLLAAVTYSLYIYCDFSSYSDMACGFAKIFGFDIKRNFRNPYLALSLSDFWNRWHMTLNSWFVENIYIPLGGNRKGTFRKYFNIFVVFFVSGIWHGASYSFVVWGVLNGLLRIFGEILTPFKKKLYSLAKIDENCVSVRVFKRAVVFLIITITWVFFRIPDIGTALHVIRNMLFFHPMSLFDANVLTLIGTSSELLTFLVCIAVFLYVQYMRKEDGKIYRVYARQPSLVQTLIFAFLIVCCIFVACSETTTLNTQFIYFQF
jgi:D-alanyl-lipoteichoic acid acyltransferase DltB (MBOAT superfamily)